MKRAMSGDDKVPAAKRSAVGKKIEYMASFLPECEGLSTHAKNVKIAAMRAEIVKAAG
jgi:hypothetical protein